MALAEEEPNPAGGCGDTNGKTKIDQTENLKKAYEFGKELYTIN